MKVFHTIDEVWLLKQVDSLVDRYAKVASTKLGDYSQILSQQGKDADLVLGSVLYFLPVTERFYREERAKIIEQFDSKDYNASEIESMIKGLSAKHREIRDMMLSMSKFLSNRITYIQSLLKFSDEKHKMDQ